MAARQRHRGRTLRRRRHLGGRVNRWRLRGEPFMSSPFLDSLRSGRVLLMDGAIGTELQKFGLKSGERGEFWNLTQPERVFAICAAYVAAGADVILTNSFLANPEWLAPHDALREINRLAVELAQRAAGSRCHLLASIGPFSGSRRGLFAMRSPLLPSAGLLVAP